MEKARAKKKEVKTATQKEYYAMLAIISKSSEKTSIFSSVFL